MRRIIYPINIPSLPFGIGKKIKSFSKHKNMKPLFSFLLTSFCFITCFSQTTISNYKKDQPIYWGSWSAQAPSYGFYGQEFEFSKDVEVYSFMVYIYDDPGHDETQATINYSIWSFDTIPQKEIFLSAPVSITKTEIDNWEKFEFKTPLKLPKGRYLFSVGQSKLQGFVAFGDGTAKDDYHSILWAKTPSDEDADGKKWFDLNKLMISQNDSLSDEEKKLMNQAVVMMQLEYK